MNEATANQLLRENRKAYNQARLRIVKPWVLWWYKRKMQEADLS